MSRAKGTNIAFMHKLLKEKGGADLVEAFLKKLSPEDGKVFNTALPSSWIDVTVMAHFFEAIVQTVYPSDPQGLRKFAREIAKDNMKGLYKFILSICTVPMIIKQSAAIWHVYYDKGVTKLVKGEGDHAVFSVEDFSDMPLIFGEEIAGYLEGLLGLAGAKNIKVTFDGQTSTCWKWQIDWA